MGENSDLVFFYATSPVAGVIGYGIVRTKLRQISPLWPRERAENRVIWPLRFEFDVISCLPPAVWRDQKVVLEELKVRVRAGFQALDPQAAEELLCALPGAVPQNLVLTSVVAPRARPSQPTMVQVQQAVDDPHGRTQQLLAEIGRLQRLVAETEYPLENKRVDVVWRRVQRSVPSFVFEVQVSGNITEAMGKLKQAFNLWNSNIFLVGKEEHRRPANELLAGTFHEIHDRLRFLELTQVEELHKRKRAYRELEGQLGILF